MCFLPSLPHLSPVLPVQSQAETSDFRESSIDVVVCGTPRCCRFCTRYIRHTSRSHTHSHTHSDTPSLSRSLSRSFFIHAALNMATPHQSVFVTTTLFIAFATTMIQVLYLYTTILHLYYTTLHYTTTTHYTHLPPLHLQGSLTIPMLNALHLRTDSSPTSAGSVGDLELVCICV